MTPQALKHAAIRLFGESDYAKDLASFLGKERTTVWRYLSGRTPVPLLVARAIKEHEAKRRQKS